MTKLIRSLDDNHKGRWASIRMDNGDPCWISIAQTGILVKKSKIGLLGATLYEEKNIYKAAKAAKSLSEHYSDNLTPDNMWNPVLKSIVNAVLHCSNLAEVTRVLNEADLKAENQANGSDILTSDSFKKGLMILANRIRKISGFPESEDLEDSTILVITHITSSAQRKVSHFPIEGHIKDSEVLVGLVFICFIANQLIFYLEHEGAALSTNEVIMKASLTVFRFLDPERVARIGPASIEQYKTIIKSGGTREKIREYTHAVSTIVLAYVTSQNEELLDAFSGLFTTLIDAQEN